MASKRTLEDQTDDSVSKRVKTLAHEIHEACTTNLNARKVELLIRSCNTDDAMKQEIIKDLNAMKTLHEVCTSEGLDIAQQLISLGVNINSFDSEGDSSLHIASKNRSAPLVEELLRLGANPNIRCAFDNRTPLHYALILPDDYDADSLDGIVAGMLPIVQCLLKHGADVDAQDHCGKTPLNLVLSGLAGENNMEIIQELLKYNANVDAKDSNGDTPLHIASVEEYSDVVNLLLKHNANVNSIGDGLHTPLMLASRFGNSDVVKELLRFGAKTEHPTNRGYLEPIHFAAMGGHDLILLELLKYNASIDVSTGRDEEDETALHKATKEGHIKCVEVLLEHGANMNVQNIFGETPLHVALLNYNISKENRHNIIKSILKYGTKIDLNIRTHSKLTALEMSIKFNENGEVVKQLLTLSKQNVSLNCLDKEGLSLLHYACRNRNAEVVEELLKNGANPNLKSSYLQKTKSPLHYVFEYGCGDESISIEKHNEIISIMNCLLNYGSDIEARNTDGETALYKASVWGNIPAVKFLLENGAKITYGHTNSALHDAAGYGDTEMIELLVNHNADINKMISNKGTPLCTWQMFFSQKTFRIRS